MVGTLGDTRRPVMSQKRVVEIYSAGCPVCLELIDLVNRIACSD